MAHKNVHQATRASEKGVALIIDNRKLRVSKLRVETEDSLQDRVQPTTLNGGAHRPVGEAAVMERKRGGPGG
jgi:hypothetical protein